MPGDDEKVTKIAFTCYGYGCEVAVLDAGNGGIFSLSVDSRKRKITIIKGMCVVNDIALNGRQSVVIPAGWRFEIQANGQVAYLCEFI